ncbi:MAG: autotransporter outer membrane beta-barrel domain-containing protein [Thermoguttaceae bacterium]
MSRSIIVLCSAIILISFCRDNLCAQSLPTPSDIVTVNLSVANRKLYRSAFAEMFRETLLSSATLASSAQNRSDSSDLGNSVLGQVRSFSTASPVSRSVWVSPIGRGGDFATTTPGGSKYFFDSYGVQGGSTLWSSRRSSIGVLLGYERGLTRNNLDSSLNHDYQLGFYFGHISDNGYEFRGFLGGGLQSYTTHRMEDQWTNIKTALNGSTFEANLEVSRLFVEPKSILLRPYFAVDAEYGTINSAQESAFNPHFRQYGESALSQCSLRVGLDIEKRWHCLDWNFGVGYSGVIIGSDRASVPVFFPALGTKTSADGSKLGRSTIMLKTGLNYHLDERRRNSFFADYYADIYGDRPGSKALHTGIVGYRVIF